MGKRRGAPPKKHTAKRPAKSGAAAAKPNGAARSQPKPKAQPAASPPPVVAEAPKKSRVDLIAGAGAGLGAFQSARFRTSGSLFATSGSR